MSLWDKLEIEAALEIKLKENPSFEGIAIDSRKVVSGDAFFALPGNHTDGHLYVKQAIENGANVVFVDHLLNDSKEEKQVLVNNVQEALINLANYRNKMLKAKKIAVTGSVGKTSTKEMLKLVLSNHAKTFASQGNFNNDLGLPISLASTPLDCNFAVYELGMNHAGEISSLSSSLQPEIAVITHVAENHIGYLGSLENIARAKSEIFNGVKAGGYAVINRDSDFYNIMAAEARNFHVKNIITFGMHNRSDIRLLSIKTTEDQYDIKLDIRGKIINYGMAKLGKHMVFNSLVVAACLDILSLPFDLLSVLLNFQAIQGRGKLEIIEMRAKKINLYDESYNCGPVSLAAALENLSELKAPQRKIAIIGDMLELGRNARQYHENICDIEAINNIDKFITYGENIKFFYEKLPKTKQLKHFDNLNQLKSHVNSLLEDGDAVLVKASRGTKLYELVEYLKNFEEENALLANN